MSEDLVKDLNNASSATVNSPGNRPPPLPLKPVAEFRIAFVDDEPANTRLGQRFLTKLGIPAANVTIMKDGTAALALTHITVAAVIVIF